MAYPKPVTGHKRGEIWPITVASISDLKRQHVDEVLDRAAQLRQAMENLRKPPEMSGRADDARHKVLPQSLRGKVIALLFFEPSTRTQLSFESAAIRLGASCIGSHEAATSLSKGETYADTLRVVSGYADLIVMRQPGTNTADLAKYSSVNLVNAGDGSNEHPTQALIDLYTIRTKRQQDLGLSSATNDLLEGLTIGVGFDPRHSRSIRSFLRGLAKYRDNHVVLVAPDEYQLDESEIADLVANGLKITTSNNKTDLIACDIVYINRLQRERLEKVDVRDYGEDYRLTLEDVTHSQIKHILDPLPRVDEMDKAIDGYPQEAYFDQARYGLEVRMALLEKLLAYESGIGI